jgi:hypothetical protein
MVRSVVVARGETDKAVRREMQDSKEALEERVMRIVNE